MFDIIKEKVKVSQLLKHLTDKEVIESGEWFQMEDCACPLPNCGHNDCFKISPDQERYICFSCSKQGDVINLLQDCYPEQELNSAQAARAIAEMFTIELPTSGSSPEREIFRLAADYFHKALMEDTRKYKELGNKTPLEYQTEHRGHSEEQIKKFQIGWSDGRVVSYLEGLGYELETLQATGLVAKKGTGDFLPFNTFIYPHQVGRHVGHFTFKDPRKEREYQIAGKFRDKNWAFFNQNSVKGSHTVIVVEGENDVISTDALMAEGFAVVGCIGQISRAQLQWLVDHCSDKHVIGAFDPDDGGDSYRKKMTSVHHNFLSAKDIPFDRENGKDIDELLREGVELSSILATAVTTFDKTAPTKVTVETPKGETVEIEVEPAPAGGGGDGQFMEHENAYYKIRYKDGMPIKSKVTDFVIRMRNSYIRGDKREREVVFVREDNKKSRPVMVSTEQKVSLRAFKTLVANVIDGTFFGKEDDLPWLWKFVYSGVSEREVVLPEQVGHLNEIPGWLFRDVFISDAGAMSLKGSDNVIWTGGDGVAGVRPVALEESGDQDSEIVPRLVTDLSPEERKSLEEAFINNLVKNLGSVGIALTMLGWLKSSAYSNQLFSLRGDFPFLFFWGRHGRGKTIVAKWLSSIFGMDNCGYTTISSLCNSAGFLRKIDYYSSLPVIIDEIRADRDTVEMYGTFRNWYQRGGRTLSSRETKGVYQQNVASTFLFVGQDQFTDDALKERCIPVRIPNEGRDLAVTYSWMESHKSDFSGIGLQWILESTMNPIGPIFSRMQEIKTWLVENGCKQRVAMNWGQVAAFGEIIAKEYFPDFDFVEYVGNQAFVEAEEQESDNEVAQFFQIVEGLQSMENPKIDGKHVKVATGNILHLWITEIFRIVEKESVAGTRERFSRKAFTLLLKEEPWVLGDDRAIMQDGVQRRVLKINLDSAPECIQILGARYAASA